MESRVEVLPMIADRDEALATLDLVLDLLHEVAAAYEQFVTLVEDGSAAVLLVDEIAHTFSGQAVRMNEALLALMPYVEGMRDVDGRMGPVLRGIEETLDAVGFASQPVPVAKAFGFACAVCCAMERDLAGLRTARNAAPVDLHANAGKVLVMDQHLVDALGHLLHAHWHEVRPASPRDRRLGVR